MMQGGVAADTVFSDYQISAAAAQGGRKYMEDRLHLEVGRDSNGDLDFIFAAVYDGHGGVQASQYVRQHLFSNIVNNPTFHSEDDQLVLEAIRAGFLKTHFNMQNEAEHWPLTNLGFPCTAGTTATCVFVRHGKLYTGHVGDSTIILANFMEQAAGYNDAKLTEDHKPETLPERQRIEKAGGSIQTKSFVKEDHIAGVWRVIWKRPIRGHRGPIRRSTSTENIPFLAVARSLGDFWSLNPKSNEYVVSPEPDVDVFRLKSNDNFVVLSSDGLTNVVSTQEIIQTLSDIDAKKQHIRRRHSMAATHENLIDLRYPINHAHCLLQNAFKKWGSLRADNISIICIKLNSEEMPAGHVCILDEQLEMDVSQRLKEHPFSMVHVNKTSTRLLQTNSIRHIYNGSLDKGFNAVRFGRMVNENGVLSNNNRRNSSNQDSYLGPGFILPEILADSGESTSVNSRFSLYHAGESDVEEIRYSEKHAAVLERTSEEPLKADHSENYLKAKTAFNLRAGMKRRLDSPDDDYIRHIPNGTPFVGAASSSKKVSLLEYQEPVLRPPCAKRSRLQTVLNFFTSFFGHS